MPGAVVSGVEGWFDQGGLFFYYAKIACGVARRAGKILPGGRIRKISELVERWTLNEIERTLYKDITCFPEQNI